MGHKMNFDSEFEERRIVFSDGATCTYHGNIWSNAEIMSAKIKAKHQNVILISGRTGTGKSEFAVQVAKYLDRNFTIENIFWDTEKLIKVAANKENIFPPGTAFIFDEAREGTQSLNAMSETNRRMGLFLDTIRSRGYHIFLLQPSYFMFQKSIAIYAADILFHIEKKGNPDFFSALKKGMIGEDNPEEPFDRGMGRIYDINQKKNLYIKGKRMEDMDASSSSWFSFSRSHNIIDWNEYDKRKSVAVAAMNDAFDKELEPKINSKEVRILDFKQRAYYYLNVKLSVSVKRISLDLGDTSPEVYRLIDKERDKIDKGPKEVIYDEHHEREDAEEDEEEQEEHLEEDEQEK